MSGSTPTCYNLVNSKLLLTLSAGPWRTTPKLRPSMPGDNGVEPSPAVKVHLGSAAHRSQGERDAARR